MNDDRIEGNWKMLKGKIQEQWGKLTDDDVEQAEGKWERLSGSIQSRYGRAKDAAEKEIALFRAQIERVQDEHAHHAGTKHEGDDRMTEQMDNERPGPSAR